MLNCVVFDTKDISNFHVDISENDHIAKVDSFVRFPTKLFKVINEFNKRTLNVYLYLLKIVNLSILNKKVYAEIDMKDMEICTGIHRNHLCESLILLCEMNRIIIFKTNSSSRFTNSIVLIPDMLSDKNEIAIQFIGGLLKLQKREEAEKIFSDHFLPEE